MRPVKILFVGGTGNISLPCVEESVRAGHRVAVFNRGAGGALLPPGVTSIVGDVNDAASYRGLGRRRFDVVCQFIAFTPADIARDIEAFSGGVGQYVFISSASVYEKPPRHYVITEKTPTVNPYWGYSQDKIACEAALKAASRLPWTIVRPSHTVRTILPALFNKGDSVARRMLAGKPGDSRRRRSNALDVDPMQRFCRSVRQAVWHGRRARRGFSHHLGLCLHVE